MPSNSTILAPQFNTSFFGAKRSRINASLHMHMHMHMSVSILFSFLVSWNVLFPLLQSIVCVRNTDCDFLKNKKKQVSLQLSSLMLPPLSRVDNGTFCNFSYFGYWQPSDEGFGPHDNDSFEFGNFVARKALLDEERRVSKLLYFLFFLMFCIYYYV